MKTPRLLYILQKAYYSTLQNGEWKRLHEPARSRNHYTMGSVIGSHGSDPVASAPYQLLLRNLGVQFLFVRRIYELELDTSNF